MQAIRGMLGSKYGKEYIAEASSDTYCRKWHVNENLVRCVRHSFECASMPPHPVHCGCHADVTTDTVLTFHKRKSTLFVTTSSAQCLGSAQAAEVYRSYAAP
jgi:hypothetical protein